jgi:hypothetical protein
MALGFFQRGNTTGGGLRGTPHSWSVAFIERDMVAIADWFWRYYFGIGFLALLLSGVAAALSGADGMPPSPQTAPAAVAAPAAATGRPAAARSVLPAVPSAAASTTPKPVVWSLGLRVLALGLLLAGASGVLGWLFGLIFGVPRTPKAPGNGTGAPALGVNTNLEDISDWLTKTLVGVGLTQLTGVPKFLGDIAFQANRYGFQWGDYGQLLALGIIIYFLPGGFWLGYVGTRTFLTNLFDQFASGLKKDTILSACEPTDLILKSDNTIEGPSPALRTVDAVLLGVPLKALGQDSEIVAWAAAQARAQNYGAAEAALENVLGTDRGNENVARQLVKVLLAQGKFKEAADLARSTLVQDTPPKMAAALYEPAPAGFTRALEIGERIIQDPKLDGRPGMHVWLARGYAQKLAWINAQAAPDTAAAKDARDKAIAQINRAIQIDAAKRAELRASWDGTSKIDTDLNKAFAATDAQIKALLAPPAPNPAASSPPA